VTVRRKERQEELGEGKQGKDTRKREKKRVRERERETQAKEGRSKRVSEKEDV
jgi:hypothetical protein